MDFELISKSLDLMLYGMGVVTCFLVVLVAACTAMSWLVDKFLATLPAQATARPGPDQSRATGVSPTTEQIIRKAIALHRGASKPE